MPTLSLDMTVIIMWVDQCFYFCVYIHTKWSEFRIFKVVIGYRSVKRARLVYEKELKKRTHQLWMKRWNTACMVEQSCETLWKCEHENEGQIVCRFFWLCCSTNSSSVIAEYVTQSVDQELMKTLLSLVFWPSPLNRIVYCTQPIVS